MRAPLLQVEDMARHFGGVRAVDGLSLDVYPGDIVGLIGPNGAGKTTAFNVIHGTFKPTRGRIRFDGHDIANHRPNRIVKLGLARTFQATNVFAKASVRENVLRGAHVRSPVGFWDGLFANDNACRVEAVARRKADEILQMLSLTPYADELAGSLPYGYQRRLGVAVALATDPKLLMLDEPAAGLNPEESTEFGELIRMIVQRRGLSVLLVEHHMRLVMGLCDRIIVLDHGCKIAEGTPTAIQQDEAVIAAYLGIAEQDEYA